MTPRTTTRFAFLGATALLLGTGCMGTSFSPHFRDNNLDDLRVVLSRFGKEQTGPRNALGKHMVFVVTAAPAKIIAYDLDANQSLWQVAAEITSKVVVGRSLFFHLAGKSEIVARSITDGHVVWSGVKIRGDRLMGLAADGDELYVVSENTVRSDEGTAASLVALSETGKERWVQTSSARLGAPAAQSGRVFVPVRSHSIAIVDSKSGDEISRIRSKEETLNWVASIDGAVFFGGKAGVYRLDEKSVTGTQKESSFVSAPLPASVRPAYYWDGYNAALSTYTAYDRNRLLWKVVPGQTKFVGDTIFVHNYRFFFAFDTEEKHAGGGGGQGASMQWAFSFPRFDVVSSVHTGNALVLVTEKGDLLTLEAKGGGVVGETKLKLQIRGATFDADGFQPKGAVTRRPDIRGALTEIIWDPDRRFGAVKLFCVEQLARLSGENISTDLVKIVTHEGIDPAVYKLAGQVIVDRHDVSAIPLYLETLKRHYDFVEGTAARAVDIMARALGDLKPKEAVVPLLAHLADHETPIGAVEEIVRALVTIGDKSVVDAFRDFILIYRCDPGLEKTPASLNLIAEGLLKLGGEDERQLLRFIENDSHTLKSLRTYLGEALRQTKSGAHPTGKNGPAAPPAPAKAAAAPAKAGTVPAPGPANEKGAAPAPAPAKEAAAASKDKAKEAPAPKAHGGATATPDKPATKKTGAK
jgi:outer membrane protein assembly factor BamB